MSNGIIVDASYFEGVDLDRPSIKHPIFEKMQANARAMQSQEQDKFLSQFDSDVKETIIKNSTPSDRERLNAMIRLLFGTATTT